MKYGKTIYFEDLKSEFKDSFGDAYVLREYYIAYLNDKDLLLRYIREYVEGITPDIVEEEDFGITINDLLINSEEEQFLLRFKYGNTELSKHSEEEQKICERIDEIVQKSEEKNKINRKSEKQHIRNFLRKLFRSKESLKAISMASNITEQEIETLIKGVAKEPEKPISAYIVKESQQSIKEENQNNNFKEIEKENDDEIEI